MTKTDELLKELKESIPEYVKNLGVFQFKTETCKLIDHYYSQKVLRCAVENHPIVDVYVIQDSHGNTYNIGNCCINRITSKHVKEWYKSYHRRKINLQKNRDLIDFAKEFLDHYDKGDFKREPKASNLERVRTIYKRMCDGLKPTKTQWRLIDWYIRKKTLYY